ncbi:MAG TPA: PAS domain-containing protein [Solirubrobacteraceae bacterium]|nr:PAS domain-containing protein [Solirubrobacteraceae bacterium]
MATPTTKQPEDVATAAEALLREHPDALVCGLANNGLIVPVPQSIGLWGQGLVEGRALVDNVVAEDRSVVIRLWLRAQEEGAAADRVRLLRKPSTWTTLHFLDLREIHGVLLGVILPTDEQADKETPVQELAPAAPRFCSLMEDEGARVLACDNAFTEMFGYREEELLGNSVLDQIHPDDQGRAVEGWLAVLSTGRDQQTRLRRRRKDGTWMWVDTTLRNLLNHPAHNYVLVEIIDISAEMQAQEALQEREELLRRLTAAMPVGLLHLDAERNVVYNNARLLEILRLAHYEPRGGTRERRAGARARAPDARRASRRGSPRLRRRAAQHAHRGEQGRARRRARRSAHRRRRPRRRGRHHAAVRHVEARADEPARAVSPDGRDDGRDHVRARHHRQRTRAPGARAPRDVRPPHPLPQPLLRAQRARARARA